MTKLSSQLFELLSIHSPSRDEHAVVAYMVEALSGLVDELEVDEIGNIFAVRKCGPDDYTVLLNAHMDTVARERPIPYWRNGFKQIATKSNSALGGDDKCGLAVHLEVLRNLEKTKFTGTVKVLFSVSEEIGCVGATRAAKERPDWFKGIDVAIVVDRMFGDDIVTSCMGEEIFCSLEYGTFWEDMSRKTGFKAEVTEGSISDTMVFAEMGINSVNLSAGYYSPHSAQEHIKVKETERTARWIKEALSHIQAQGKFPEFKYFNPRPSWNYANWSSGGTFFGGSNVNDEWDYCDNCGEATVISDLFKVPEMNEYVCIDCLRTSYSELYVARKEIAMYKALLAKQDEPKKQASGN